uniref:Uncharacterized protein n=1 Tax=Cacopsylla melanoneura TaxID=428564 RepID=A0A8D9E8Y5_9HEMI
MIRAKYRYFGVGLSDFEYFELGVPTLAWIENFTLIHHFHGKDVPIPTCIEFQRGSRTSSTCCCYLLICEIVTGNRLTYNLEQNIKYLDHFSYTYRYKFTYIDRAKRGK